MVPAFDLVVPPNAGFDGTLCVITGGGWYGDLSLFLLRQKYAIIATTAIKTSPPATPPATAATGKDDL